MSAASSTGNLRAKIFLIVANLAAVICLIWALRHANITKLWPEIIALDWRWVLLAVVADISVYIAQAWRWNILLTPVVHSPLWRTVRAIYVGLFANEVLPMRTGEVIRCYLMGRWNQLPFSVVLSSGFIERIFDGVWLIVLFFVTLQFVPLPGLVHNLAWALMVLVGILGGLLVMIILAKPTVHRLVSDTGKWKHKLLVLIDDVHAMGSSRTFLLSFLASPVYIMLQAVPIFAILRAYGFDKGSLAMGAVLMIVLRLGTVVPNAPGNVGTFQVLTAAGLGLFIADQAMAYRFSFILWGVVTLPLLIAGFIALFITGFKLSELQKQAQAIADEPEQARAL